MHFKYHKYLVLNLTYLIVIWAFPSKIYSVWNILLCITVGVLQCTNLLGPFTQMVTHLTQWAQHPLHHQLIIELAQMPPELLKHQAAHKWLQMQLPHLQGSHVLFQIPCQIWQWVVAQRNGVPIQIFETSRRHQMGPFQGKLKYTPNGLFMRLLINASLHTHPVLIFKDLSKWIVHTFNQLQNILLNIMIFYFTLPKV